MDAPKHSTASPKLLGAALPRAIALLERVEAAPGVVRAALAGEARRGCETVQGVVLVAATEHPGPALEAFMSHSSVTSASDEGPRARARLAPDGLEATLYVVRDEDFVAVTHELTGSTAHRLRLQALARSRGLRLTGDGLYREAAKLPLPDEDTLYSLLGLAYVPPELREDTGEVEAALARQLPIRLIEPSDVKGAIHSHSTWSDGRNSLEEMARAAQALGYSYLTVTEHSQAADYARGMSPERLHQQWDEIDALNAKLDGFRLLKGIEADILEDGALDFSNDVLRKLDVVIASVHVRHGMDERRMTDRVLKALDHPLTQILGHPTGRLIPSREPCGMDMEAVFTRAAERGVALEVNGNPERLDLKAEHVRRALELGASLVVSVDAHATDELARVAYSAATARRGWATPERVLNTLAADQFLAALRSR
jgi:DNA polymerase (family 10)